MKRYIYSGFLGFFTIFLILMISRTIHSDNQIPDAYELIFYQENNDFYFKSGGLYKKHSPMDFLSGSVNIHAGIDDKNAQKTQNDISKPSFLKYRENELFFSGEGTDLWRLDFKTESANKVIEALKKPVEYNPSLKRKITGYDEKTGFVLYEHEILNQKNSAAPQKIQTNFSSSERLFALDSDEKHLYVGTAVNGLYYSTITEQEKSGQKFLHFTSLNAGLPYIPFEGNIRFYEEIHTLHISQNGDILAGIGIQGGVYLRKANENRFQPLPWPEKWETSDVYLITTGKNGTIWVSCTQGLIIYVKDKDSFVMKSMNWSSFSYPYKTFLIRNPIDADLYAYYINPEENIKPEKLERMKTASSKRLFYSSPYNLKIKPSAIKALLNSGNYDGIVLDVKDDRGQVLYKSNVPFISKIGALRPIMDLPAFIQMVHEYKKYIAVRVVVFKDPVVFEQPGYAIWDSSKDEPWIGNEKERWVDPFNPALAENYYVPLVKELTALGVDEIQLDYIRFPSDGPLNICHFRHRKDGKYFSEGIEDFLYSVRKATTLPISLDIYGYQGLYRTAGAIGQDMELFGKFSDVISPMLYSSHFGNEYMTNKKIEDRVYELIKHSVRRAGFIARDRFLIRPYLQAFPMKTAIWGYGGPYFLDQIRANQEEQGSGYSFWGSIDHMAAVDKAMDTLK